VTGYVRAQKTCTLDGAPPSAFASQSEESDSAPDFSMLSPPSRAPAPVEAAPPKPEAPAAPSPIQPPASGQATQWRSNPAVNHAQNNNNAVQRAYSNKRGPGVTTNCAQYYNVQSGDFCNKVAKQFSTSFARLRELNTELNQDCTNLWLGYDYCVTGLS
jgi:LysM repeat protein